MDAWKLDVLKWPEEENHIEEKKEDREWVREIVKHKITVLP